MFFLYRKISNIFPRSNHDQYDGFMDYDHDHDHDNETLTGFIKIDNQIIFTREFTKKHIQIYDAMVEVLKQIKITKRVNEILKMNLTSKNTMIKRIFLPPIFLTPFFIELFNSLITKNREKFVKSLNRTNIFFVLNFEPIMIGIP